MFTFMQGNLSEGYRAFGPYDNANDVLSTHDGEEGWMMELARKQRYFAMLSKQGTACAETTLNETEYNDPVTRTAAENRARHTTGPDRPIPGNWTEVTDNDFIKGMFN